MSPDRKAESTFYSKPTPKEEDQALFFEHEADHERDISATPEFENMYISAGSREQQDDRHERMEDAIYNDPEKYVFGVFDGAGGEVGNPAAASRAAAEEIGKALSSSGNVVNTYGEIEDDLRDAFEKGQKAVKERGEGGITVGTAAKLYSIDNRPMLGVAQAGDTRMFLYDRTTQKYMPITPDQSVGNRIQNWLADDDRQTKEDYYTFIPVKTGDRVMICSDGITGDYPDQAFSSEEFTDAFTQPTADEAAQKFLDISTRQGKKKDDKSVLVFDIDTLENKPAAQQKQTASELAPPVTDADKKRSKFAQRMHDLALQLGLPADATNEQIAKARKAKASQDNVAANFLPPMPKTKPQGISSIDHPIAAMVASIMAEADSDKDDEERQYEIDKDRGFTVTDKRAPRVDPRENQTIAVTQYYNVPALPDRDPIIQNYRIPPKPAYAPTIHHPAKPDHDPSVHSADALDSSVADDEPGKKQSLKERVMDKINMPFQELATRLTWAHMILSRENQEKSDEEKPDKEKRRKIIKRVLGVAAIVAVAAVLARDNPEFQNAASEMINGHGGGDLNPPEVVDPLQERIIEQHAEALSLPAHDIPFNGGGEQYAIAHGVDPALWYQNEAEFLELFPDQAHSMNDGHVGFDRPGELSDEAKIFWLKKFGKWL